MNTPPRPGPTCSPASAKFGGSLAAPFHHSIFIGNIEPAISYSVRIPPYKLFVKRSSGEPGVAKTRKRTISMPSKVLASGVAIFPGGPLQHRRLQAATRHRSIVFAPEGLPLDRCVTLNCGIWVQSAVLATPASAGPTKHQASSLRASRVERPNMPQHPITPASTVAPVTIMPMTIIGVHETLAMAPRK